MPTYDDTQIANLALSNCGCGYGLIADLATDTNAEAKACRQWYTVERDRTLELADWRFASRSVPLAAAVTGYGDATWTYGYALPVDVIAVRELTSPDPTTYPAGTIIPYDLQAGDGTQRLLLTNYQGPNLRYTAQITAPSIYPPGFVDVLSWRLAAKIAMPLSLGKGMQQQCLDQAQRALDSAYAQGAMQRKPQPVSPGYIAGRD